MPESHFTRLPARFSGVRVNWDLKFKQKGYLHWKKEVVWGLHKAYSEGSPVRVALVGKACLPS